MKAVGISRANLIGHSMGGYICIWIAAHQPEVVDHLVLVSPAGIPRIRSPVGLCHSAGRGSALFDAELLPYSAVRCPACWPAHALTGGPDLLTKDVRDCLHSIVAPTLLIWGEDDTLVPPSLGDILHQEIAHSQFMALKKAGHVGMFDEPQRFNTAVLTFLAEEPQLPPAKIAVPPPPASAANYSLHSRGRPSITTSLPCGKRAVSALAPNVVAQQSHACRVPPTLVLA